MAEVKDAPQSAAATEEKKPGNIVSRGAVTQVKFTTPDEQNSNGGDAGAGGETAEEKTAREAKELLLKNETPDQKTARELAEKNKPPELTEDQRKAYLAKELGIENFDGNVDALKEKLKPATPTADPEIVAKEKATADAAFEKRMVDYFLENGGTVEQFAHLKAIAGSDLKELSASEIRREMKEAKFDDDEIAVVLKERYYQINPEELVRDEDKETEEEFEKRKALTEKKIAFGSKKMESKSSHIKKAAESALSTLREVINSQDAQKVEDAKNSQRVEEFFTKSPRKLTFELGKAGDGHDITPIDVPVPEEIITEVMDTFKDPDKRNKFLYNEDNSLNIDNVGQLAIRNKVLEAALKEAYSKGGSHQVDVFEKRFPGRTAKDIGVGGANGGEQGKRKGVIVSRGAPEPVVRNS